MCLHAHFLPTQNGGLTDGADKASMAVHPLWAAGIDGKGQVIGAGDSGLDFGGWPGDALAVGAELLLL